MKKIKKVSVLLWKNNFLKSFLVIMIASTIVYAATNDYLKNSGEAIDATTWNNLGEEVTSLRAELEALKTSKADTTALPDMSGYYTKAEVDTEISNNSGGTGALGGCYETTRNGSRYYRTTYFNYGGIADTTVGYYGNNKLTAHRCASGYVQLKTNTNKTASGGWTYYNTCCIKK